MNNSNLTIRLKQKILEKDWIVSDDIQQAWIEKLKRNVVGVAASSLEFQLEEIFHYLKLQHIQELTIPQQSEHQYIVDLYSAHEVVPSHSSPKENLQSPDVTFGETILSKPCIYCKKTNVSTMILQLRSADEPSTYVETCPDCGKTWKHS